MVADKKFEEALQRLDEVVRSLESGELSLEAALDLFAEGVDLARYCYGMLDAAEQRLQVLAGVEVSREEEREDGREEAREEGDEF